MTDPGDVRLRGFPDRAALAAAWAWLDTLPAAPDPEFLGLTAMAGRVLAQDIFSHAALPEADRAAADGYAVRAAECDGASAYNPLTLAWRDPGAAVLPAGAACPIAAGWVLPEGADAVLPFEAAERVGTRWLEILSPVAPGAGVDRRGILVPPGAILMRRGRRLLARDVACLAAIGLERVAVRPRPRVRVVVPGPKSGPDMVTPLLMHVLARDGARAAAAPMAGDAESDIAQALSGAEKSGAGVKIDLVLIAGRSGAGPDDAGAPAVRAAGGHMALHGVALRPGGSAGLGMIGQTPVILLPGAPFACLAAYDLLAGRLVRRLAGQGLALPYPVAALPLARKIASGIGLADLVAVRVVDGTARPVGADAGFLALLADGFVIVEESSEGFPEGATVRVNLYREIPRCQ